MLWTSAKANQGIAEIFPAIIDRIPCPGGSRDRPLTALLFDSWCVRARPRAACSRAVGMRRDARPV